MIPARSDLNFAPDAPHASKTPFPRTKFSPASPLPAPHPAFPHPATLPATTAASNRQSPLNTPQTRLHLCNSSPTRPVKTPAAVTLDYPPRQSPPP